MRKRSAPLRKSPQVDKSKKKLSLNFFLAIFFIAVIFSIAWFLVKIENINCFVDNQPDPQLCQSLGFLKNKSLFFTRFDQTPLFTSTLVNEQGQVFEPLKFEKKLPDTLIIYFHKQDPIYKLNFEENTFVVNSQGYLAEDSSQFNLPTVNLSDSYHTEIGSKKVATEFHELISNFIEYFNQQELIYNDFRLNKEQSVLRISGIDYIFEDETDAALLAVKIKLINNNLAEMKQDLEVGEEIESIDVRFNLPVVKLKGEGN
jgi:hypothetical protein